MTGPEGNSEFCFPRISMFPETKSRETLRFEGNRKIHCSPRDQSLSDLLYSKTKQKQNLKTALRFQPSRATAVNISWVTVNCFPFDVTFLPGGREFDSNLLENVKIPPYALPPPPAGLILIGALIPVPLKTEIVRWSKWDWPRLRRRFDYTEGRKFISLTTTNCQPLEIKFDRLIDWFCLKMLESVVAFYVGMTLLVKRCYSLNLKLSARN